MTALAGTEIQDILISSILMYITLDTIVIVYMYIIEYECDLYVYLCSLFESFESLKNSILLSLKLLQCEHTFISEVLDLLQLL